MRNPVFKPFRYWVKHFCLMTEVCFNYTEVTWPLDAKNWLTGKDPDAGKDWRCEEKGMTEDEMVGWHHQLDGHEFEQAPGVGDGQGCLVCYSPWGHKELDTTEWLNWSDFILSFLRRWCLYLDNWGGNSELMWHYACSADCVSLKCSLIWWE